MSASRPVVAIAGATGHLGRHVASAFLSPFFRSKFSDIILLSRKDASSIAGFESNAEYTVRKYDEDNISKALQGVQVLVNTVGPAGHSFKEKLLQALPQTDVEIYFPSEFGVDHYVHDFAHLEWDEKKKHFALAQKIIPNVKVCRLFCGLFLEDNRCCAGHSAPDLAPSTLHVGGDTRSISEIASIMGDAGAGQIEVTEIPLDEYKKEKTATPSWDPAGYLRFLMGEDKIDHTDGGLGGDNELVNPQQLLWKWTTLADLAEHAGGRPWNDYVWPPQ
ncbi:hypothetical protein N7450_008552 [Penicillium hetheringtonii]|uniref:NmrA-like domain-containing protein n=1 Tax=Penicillium hetheringtonii TaxID=911720 RepID=A0AAD6DD33_9EURO|nr:hypothetical protein N7450_008552 [Penicillium hetheringtonii]